MKVCLAYGLAVLMDANNEIHHNCFSIDLDNETNTATFTTLRSLRGGEVIDSIELPANTAEDIAGMLNTVNEEATR